MVSEGEAHCATMFGAPVGRYFACQLSTSKDDKTALLGGKGYSIFPVGPPSLDFVSSHLLLYVKWQFVLDEPLLISSGLNWRECQFPCESSRSHLVDRRGTQLSLRTGSLLIFIV